MTEPVTAHRRALHRIPELDNDLPETAAYVTAALERLPCAVFSPIKGSVCAFFDAGRAETAAFRADMDALPVREQTGLAFASVHPGVMHACGHDGHTAMALALAEDVAGRLSELPRNLLFLFQPSEETTGGARALCESGILGKYNVTRVFGMHLWPELPEGRIFCRPGPMMARSSEITVTVTGRSVHISKYREGRDALTAGAEFLRRAYDMVSGLPGGDQNLLRFGKMTSGTVRNAVSGKTVLEGTFRTWSEDAFAACRAALTGTGRALEAETGCGVEVHCSEGYPPVINDAGLYAAVRDAMGGDVHELPEPVLGADDFSFYQRHAPGLYFFLGVGMTSALHAPDFDFDDETVLRAGLAFWRKLAALD